MKPNAYTQIHIQVVFAVKYRQALILPSWKEDLKKYMTGIVQKHGHKMLAIDGVEDHFHLFFGFKPTQSLSDLVREVKRSSTNWINENNLTKSQFLWQNGYGAFSYCNREVPKIINYVRNQVDHHKRQKFQDEYFEMLKDFEVDYDEMFVFHDPI